VHLSGFLPQKTAKTARVTVTQATATRQYNIDVVVFLYSPVIANDAEGTRHSQMHDKRPGLGGKQKILCPPLNGDNPLPAKLLVQVSRHRPPQARVANNKLQHLFAIGKRCDSTAGCFNFWQLWHTSGLWNQAKKNPASAEFLESKQAQLIYLILPSLYITC
jgi:hypothetical protein